MKHPSESLPKIAKPCPMDWEGMNGDARRLALASAAVCLPMVFSHCATRRTMGTPVPPDQGAEQGTEAGQRRVVPGMMSTDNLWSAGEAETNPTHFLGKMREQLPPEISPISLAIPRQS